MTTGEPLAVSVTILKLLFMVPWDTVTKQGSRETSQARRRAKGVIFLKLAVLREETHLPPGAPS